MGFLPFCAHHLFSEILMAESEEGTEQEGQGQGAGVWFEGSLEQEPQMDGESQRGSDPGVAQGTGREGRGLERMGIGWSRAQCREGFQSSL